MTETPWANEPSWKARLLEHIQDLSTSAVGPHRHQALIDAQARAVAIGLPPWWIEHARILGRCGSGPTGTHRPKRRNTPRNNAIEALAADLWELQHVAALAAARLERLAAVGIMVEPDPAHATFFDQNMVQLWLRTCDAVRTIEPDDAEREQLWASDIRGWRRIVAATVDTYSDRDLYRRWIAYATAQPVKILTTSARGDTARQQGAPAGPDVWWPPKPADMITAATDALRHRVDPPVLVPTVDIEAAIDAARARAWADRDGRGAPDGPIDERAVEPGSELEL
ncbi:hypothetical protein [Nocardia terpenica]|uniref:Uncharacterized protein n=1 Tax=Nocardia terpenica TaxID=455432 RepID=A0A164JI39_9NOCA|nr:hypothetical protein [Nocardia terpenica]KZM70424.1 hypothetical protein AWN90_03855 [Nocardia terpenica]NQE91106.1 hypothetical protein [Nocardia terpenica]